MRFLMRWLGNCLLFVGIIGCTMAALHLIISYPQAVLWMVIVAIIAAMGWVLTDKD